MLHRALEASPPTAGPRAHRAAHHLRHESACDAELVSDELDARSDGGFEHRFRFWPDVVFGVGFDQVDVMLSPASGQVRQMG